MNISNSDLHISTQVAIPSPEIEITPIRSQGAGGQNVNKVSTAVHLRFDIKASSLPEAYKGKLLALNDHHISKDGLIIIKAQCYRSQGKNREDALDRLKSVLKRVTLTRKKRVATKPSKQIQEKRLHGKSKRGQMKKLRGKVSLD